MNNEEKIHADIPEEFRPVAAKYGHQMFTLVYATGMCSQATQVLSTFAEKHKSRHALQAVTVLANAYNQISTAYAKQMGWTEGELTQCDQDICLAFREKVQVPGSAVILTS